MSPALPLQILPSRTLVVMLVSVGRSMSTLFAPPAQFLELLRAARALASFDELQCEEPALDELLPWTGNV